MLEVVGGGGKHIGMRRPDVPATIAVIIHGATEKAGGHKLILSHGPGPRAGHLGRSGMAFTENLQRVEQFAPKISAPAAVVSQSGQGVNHRKAASAAAIVGLYAPQRHDD